VITPYTKELEIAKRAALEAGRVVRDARAAGLEVKYKSGTDPVTNADLEADTVILEMLRIAFPHDAFLTEESTDDLARLQQSRVWIVDPIDGTRDYVKGGDENVVSIGLAINGEAVLGAIYNAFRDELYLGAIGAGVTLNDKNAQPRAVQHLEQAKVSVSPSEHTRGLVKLEGKDLLLIGSGAYRMARIAAGLEDATFTHIPHHEWDICAGVGLIRAAGARVSFRNGRKIRLNQPSSNLEDAYVAAASTPLLVELLEQLP
jgi:myo-inositol-1(or 4)-monophosphatase